MKLTNVSKENLILADEIVEANTFFKRAQGLIGKKNLPDHIAWWFKKTPTVHTCFMSFPIDVVFVDRKMKVTQIVRNLKPWRVTFPSSLWNDSCFEFAGGALIDQVELGDKLYVCS